MNDIAPTMPTVSLPLTEAPHPTVGIFDGLVGASVAAAIVVPIAAMLLLAFRPTRRKVAALLAACAVAVASGGAVGAWTVRAADTPTEEQIIAGALVSTSRNPGITVEFPEPGRVRMTYPYGAECTAEIVEAVHATKRAFGRVTLAPVYGQCDAGFPVPESPKID